MRIGSLSGSLTKLNDGSSYIVAGSNITVTSSSNGNVTISSTASGGGDVGATYLVLSATGSLTNERVLAAGTGLTLTDNGAGNNATFTIDNSVVATVSGSTYAGAVKFNAGLSGSLTKLADGTSAFVAGSGINISSASNGAVTITSTNSSFDSAASYLVLSTTGSLSNERAFVASTGLTATDGGANANYTLSINDSIVATVSGTNFTGQVGLTSVKEKLNILSGATGTVTHNCSTGYIFYHSAPVANFTANFTNFTSSVGNGFATSMTLIISQSSPAYLPTAVQLDGNAKPINWLNSNTPVGNANKKDIVSFSVMGISSSYVVLGQLATFG